MSKKLKIWLFILFVLSGLTNAQEELEEIPVYKLIGSEGQFEDQSTISANQLSESSFAEQFTAGGIRNGKTKEINGRYITKSDSKSLEIYQSSGGIWYADEEQLWNITAENASLPDEMEAKQIAEAFLSSRGLLPQNESISRSSNRTEATLSVTYLGISGTRAALIDPKNNTTYIRQLDVQVNYGLRVKEDSIDLPVVGGGGDINIVEGSRGDVIAYSGPRPGLALDLIGRYPIIPRKEADELFKRLINIENASIDYEADLAYYLPPNTQNQSYLIPVYVYRATVQVENESIPLRKTFISATTFQQTVYPNIASTTTMGLTSDPDKERRRNLSRAPIASNSVITLPNSTAIASNSVALIPNSVVAAINPSMYEYGTYWCGVAGGPANTQGFVDEMAATGWTKLFQWGGADAWESDWNQNEDLLDQYNTGIDNADIIFYTGHASENSWLLSPPNDNWLDKSEVQGRYGDNDAEWIVIAACGPLEDSAIMCSNNPIDAVNNWGPVFNGLHGLLGYASVTSDTDAEGRLFARYMKEGNTIVDSWFRTAREVQDSTNGYDCPYGPEVYAAALVPYRGDVSAENDHLWGYGSVSSDIQNADKFWLIWSPC